MIKVKMFEIPSYKAFS